MAIHIINAVIVANYDTKKNTDFTQGAALARDLSGADAGLVRKADRASDTAANWVGLAADNNQRSGNTIILNDPVGSTYVDGSGNLVSNANGFYVGEKRAIGDFQDETVNNVTNLTAGAGGFEGPRRGVGVYTTPSGQFITDQFVAVATSSATADSGSAITFAIGDSLTFGAGANAGKLVRLANAAHGRAVAVVEKYDAAAGLLWIQQV
jgi:hypothetical protein